MLLLAFLIAFLLFSILNAERKEDDFATQSLDSKTVFDIKSLNLRRDFLQNAPLISTSVSPLSFSANQASSKSPTQFPTNFRSTTAKPLSRLPSGNPSSAHSTALPTHIATPSSKPISTQSPSQAKSSPTRSPSNKPSSSQSPTPHSPTFPPSKLPSKTPSSKPITTAPSHIPSRVPTMPTSAPTYSGLDMSYHPRNPVLTGNVHLYNIFYGNFNGKTIPSTVSLVNYFAANVGNSSWYKTIPSSYYQENADNSTTYASNNVTLVKSINIYTRLSAAYRPVVLNESMIIASIVNAFNSGSLPVDTNAIYSVIFRGDFTFNAPDGTSWLQDWCSYHSAILLSDGRIIKYTVMGDTNYARSQQFSCAEFSGTFSVNGNSGADAVVNSYGLELANTITGWSGAWYRDSMGEWRGDVGDVCLFNFGVDLSQTNWNIEVGTKKFLVQDIWRNGYGCVHSCC